MTKSVVRRALATIHPSSGHPRLTRISRVGLAALVAGGVLALTPAGAQGAGGTPAAVEAAPQAVVSAPTLHLTAKEKAHLRRVAAERREARRERIRAQRAVVTRDQQIRKALDTALAQQGDPYVWGATGPSSFDCSGLTSYAYAAAGLSLPRTAAEQSAYVRTIPQSEVKPGDFVFFGGVGSAYHVGLFLRWENGRGIIVHAPHPGAVVREEAIWTSDWTAGTLRLS